MLAGNRPNACRTIYKRGGSVSSTGQLSCVARALPPPAPRAADPSVGGPRALMAGRPTVVACWRPAETLPARLTPSRRSPAPSGEDTEGAASAVPRPAGRGSTRRRLCRPAAVGLRGRLADGFRSARSNSGERRRR